MQVYRCSSQKSTEQPKCKDLQRTLHSIRAYQSQSYPEVWRCRVSVLNRINSTLPVSLFFKNHTRAYTNSLKGFLWRLKQNPTVVKQKSIISDAREGHFLHLLAYLGRRESHLNTMWKKLQTEAVFSPKSQSRGSLWRPFSFGGAACGTLGALVWVPFCDFGKVLGSSGARAPQRRQNWWKMGAGREAFLSHLSFAGQ